MNNIDMSNYYLIDGSVCELRHTIYKTTVGSLNDQWIVGIDKDNTIVALHRPHLSNVWSQSNVKEIKQLVERYHDVVSLYLKTNQNPQPWAISMIGDSKKMVHILYLMNK